MTVRGLYTICVTIVYGAICKLFELVGLSVVNDFVYELLNSFDGWAANILTSFWDRNLERIATAPMKIISNTLITPDENIKIDRQKIGDRTVVTPLECWLTDEAIDYSIFFDYYIDPNLAKEALSRILAKTPIIGGVWVQIDDKQIGIDHSDPSIPFIHAQTDYIPSTNPKDAEEPYYYTKYTNGACKLMPFPAGKHVFKITMTHYPSKEKKNDDTKQDDDDDNNNKWNTLIAVGCSHALCDAEALFILLRGWASELRGVGDDEYSIPDFSRHRLILKQDEIKKFDKNTSILGKHFGNSTIRKSWWMSSIWPSRRWKPRTWIWSKQQINSLKQAAFNGKAGDKLKEIGRISGNDVLLALYWKLNATLNSRYEYNRPIMCTMVINTRKWIPDRFPKNNINYFGNALAFLVLHEQRGKLIEMDFSEIVLRVRETVMKLKSNDFEQDLNFYTQWIQENPIRFRQCFQGRWAVAPSNHYDKDIYGGYWHSHYLHDRDMMVSNLMKLDTHTMNMGHGDPICVRFNHRDEPTMMTYVFKYPSQKNDQFEFYGAFPREYDTFFEKYDIQDPNLNWNEINKNYVKYPFIRQYIREYPCMRCIRIYPKRDCCSNRKDKKANFAFIEL